jgi:hypothetical protein
MDTLTKLNTNKGSSPTKKAVSAPPAVAPPAVAPNLATTKMVNPDESKLLQGEGANLLDIERNITKNSNSLQVTNKQDTENVLPNNTGKEAFQSNYQLV